MISVHEGLKPFKCDSCEKDFTAKQSLLVHTYTIHKKKEDFKCTSCDAADTAMRCSFLLEERYLCGVAGWLMPA